MASIAAANSITFPSHTALEEALAPLNVDDVKTRIPALTFC